MNEKSDAQLLRDYAEHGHDAAFREIVTRHTDFVYSAALRQVESSAVAADLAQNVFVDLARKAKPVGEQLPDNASLAGWLHRSTRYAALNHLRDTQRRRANERLAMEQLLTDSEPAVNWEQIRPALDEALDALNDDDREALLLRYFKSLDFRAVGLTLGVSDDTAQKRVSRALERLREFFSKRNVTIGASGLTILISANAVQSAPIGLAVTISAAAILTGATISTSTTIATTKIIAMTTLQKTFVTAVSAALVAAAGAGILEQHQAAQLREQNKSLQLQIARLQNDNTNLSNRIAQIGEANKLSESQFDELLKLRGQIGVLRWQTNELAELEVQTSQLQEQIQNLETNQLSLSDKFELAQLHYGNAASAIVIAANRYMETNNGQYPTGFDQLNLSTTNFTSDIELTNFEFVDTTNWQGEKIFFQVRVPIQNPNGNWVEIDGATNHTEISNVNP